MRDGVRYARPGRPRLPVDADVAECLGIHWAELAADRKLWASAKIVYMMHKGAKLDASGGLGCYPFHYSNKTLDLIGATSMMEGMSVVFKVDSVLVANQVKRSLGFEVRFCSGALSEICALGFICVAEQVEVRAGVRGV